MSLQILPFVRFHLLKWIGWYKFSLLVIAAATILALAAGIAMLRQWQSLHLAKTTLADLVNASNATRAKNAREKPQLSAAPLDLPHFNSGQLVAQLNAVAKDAGLALNKVVYVLEESGNQPYLRYRITLSSTMKYPVVRGFAEQLDGSIPHLSFDAIACARKEISVVELSCDLVMSGFFRKQSDG